MKVLLVTEKSSPAKKYRDGGSRLVQTFKKALGNSLHVMQFGPSADKISNWSYEYPHLDENRFMQRVKNASFISERIQDIERQYTHIIFIHVSMQFGHVQNSLLQGAELWTFPMFLTPSYVRSGEKVPHEYTSLEQSALTRTGNIIVPSFFEKQQLTELYNVREEKIHVIPRGITTKHIKSIARKIKKAPSFCSVGTIKPQKNTLGLIKVFSILRKKYPLANLKIIGPIQNDVYYEKVQNQVKSLNLSKEIHFTGYADPSELSELTQKCHLHLSLSRCETFGRSIFETLAMGLPNVALKDGNAAAEYLGHLPYASFNDCENSFCQNVTKILEKLEPLSSMAAEIKNLYDDELLGQLLVATILKKEVLAVSDFDGTLFHKNDASKTERCIRAFKTFPKRVICSARPTAEILDYLKRYHLDVDWIVSYAGAQVTKGCGKPLWSDGLNPKDISRLMKKNPTANQISHDQNVLQLSSCLKGDFLFDSTSYRLEEYQGVRYLSHWTASKLHAVLKLLRFINWTGQVRVFGDGPYDEELIRYFDGTLITENPINCRQQREIVNA